MIVAMPDIMIARLGSRPITTGKTNVAPNIATTCWAPMPTVLTHESRSSGLTTSPGASPRPSPCSFHPIAMAALQDVVAGTLELRFLLGHRRKLPNRDAVGCGLGTSPASL